LLRVVHAYKVYTPEVIGGIPEVIRLVAGGLAQSCSSRILVSRMRGRGGREMMGEVPVHRVTSLGNLLSMPLAPTYPLSLWADAYHADLVAYHAPFPLVDLAVSLHFPRHTALIVHWHAEIVAQRRLLPVVAPLIRRTLARAERIIVSSQAMIDGSPTLRPFADKCAVIPFGIDASAWSTLSAEESAKVAELRTRCPRLVVAVGRLVRYKGFDVLIEAMRNVEGQLTIVGTGPLENALQRQIAEAGLAHRIRIAGYLPQPQLKCLLHASRVFVLPSIANNEAFGIAQLEAIACAKPVVNTQLSTGVSWVARDGLEAVTVAPGAVDDLARALGQLLDDNVRAARLGSAGRQRVADQFGLADFLAGVLAVYRQAVLARQSSSRNAFCDGMSHDQRPDP
jgi:rhamnosyl/mannosyltransferase